MSRKEYIKDWRHRRKNNLPTKRQEEYFKNNKIGLFGKPLRRCKECNKWKSLHRFRKQSKSTSLRRYTCNYCINNRKSISGTRPTKSIIHKTKRRVTCRNRSVKERKHDFESTIYYDRTAPNQNDIVGKENGKGSKENKRKSEKIVVDTFICVFCEKELSKEQLHRSGVCCKTCYDKIKE